MARMREIGASFDKGYRDDLNYNFGLLEALIGEANGLTDNLREEMLEKIFNLQQQIDMLTGENIGELLERLNDSIQQALTAAQDARTAKTATEEATALATAATELANASALLAEEKANYANEKAVLAQEAADNANQEASNLSQLKIDVVQATQNADTATGNANQATQAAQTATNAINVVLPNVEGLVNLKEWNTETQYKKNNFVTLEGNGYMALRDNKGVRPPSSPVLSNADWAMFVQKGEKGEQGTGVRILGTLPDESSLPPIGEPGDAYLINGDLYVWSDTTNDWTNVGTIKGPKGETGPQGPEGPQGLPGKDADLTEVNQEITNIKQTVTDNKTEVTEHLEQDVLSENGAHGIRYFNDKLETKNGNTWSEIEIDKSNARGTQSLSPYHAIRRFPVFNGWANDSTAESLWLVFKDMTLNGQLLIRGAVHNGISTANAGGFEYSLNVFRLVGDTSSLANPTEIVYLGSYVADRFVLGSQVVKVTTKQPLIPITKRKSNAAIYLEIEYLTGEGNAFEALDSIEFELQVPEATPNESPKQQSIFTHVGNSKQNLATAITGKGVTTSADATFAQMVANINAIPTGKKEASGTTNSSSGNLSFSYYGGGGSQSAPSLNLLLPFKPSVVYAVYEASGLYYTTLFSSNALEGKSGDFGSAKVTSYTGGSYNPSALNFYAQPSVSGENFQIVMPVVAGTNSKPFKWYAFE